LLPEDVSRETETVSEIGFQPNFDPFITLAQPLGEATPMPSGPTAPGGIVYLVGAGPGDPGLITLRGVECLRRADLVLYDYLANPRLLEHARGTAERICLGRHGQGRLLSQEDINEHMVQAAQTGRTVVRLKGGDPAIFARAAEEIAALEAAQVPYEVVPGITTALAVGSYAGVPLTHRDQASAVALVTGHEDGEKTAAALDYAALARFPGTLVFYMGMTTAEHWSRELIRHGRVAQTPAIIVRRCSWPDQARIDCTLETLVETIRTTRLRPPAVIVVGEVAVARETATWFTRRPLFGQTVLVTRAVEQAGELRQLLEERGARVLIQPAIEIAPLVDKAALDRQLEQLASFDWVVFNSVNGVQAMLGRVWESGRDVRAVGAAKIAAIGPGTAEALARYGLRADVVPVEYRAEGLAEALEPKAQGKRFLIARASRGREVLAERLTQAGGVVEQVVVYESRDVTGADPQVATALSEGKVDWVTVTSSAIANSLASLFGPELRKSRLASISSVTTAMLTQLGYPPAVEANEATMEGLVAAIAGSSQRG
jgi:uroporphyrinogen III methyltransferase/synthase